MNWWNQYQRVGTIEARPYVEGEDLTKMSVSPCDRPVTAKGGMVGRNPDNHWDQWYIAPEFFAKHYALAEPFV